MRKQTVRFSPEENTSLILRRHFDPRPAWILHFLALQLLPPAEFPRDWFLKKPPSERREDRKRNDVLSRCTLLLQSFTSCAMHTRAVSLDNVARYLYCGKDVKAWASQFAFLPFFSGSTLQNETHCVSFHCKNTRKHIITGTTYSVFFSLFPFSNLHRTVANSHFAPHFARVVVSFSRVYL